MTKAIFLLVILALVGLLLYLTWGMNTNCASTCTESHSQNGHDYVWLMPLGHGMVKQVYFEEPVGSGNWILYDDNWWKTHCSAVSHQPDNLVQAHMKAFVNEGRFARMMFIFEDGTRMEPTQQFWELEADYFRKNPVC